MKTGNDIELDCNMIMYARIMYMHKGIGVGTRWSGGSTPSPFWSSEVVEDLRNSTFLTCMDEMVSEGD